MNEQHAPRSVAQPQSLEEAHVYHHYDNDGPRINVKVEKNSKGYNYEATVTGARDVDEAMRLVNEAIERLAAQYGN